MSPITSPEVRILRRSSTLLLLRFPRQRIVILPVDKCKIFTRTRIFSLTTVNIYLEFFDSFKFN